MTTFHKFKTLLPNVDNNYTYIVCLCCPYTFNFQIVLNKDIKFKIIRTSTYRRFRSKQCKHLINSSHNEKHVNKKFVLSQHYLYT